jgi:Protein of unknown function (DUF1573)
MKKNLLYIIISLTFLLILSCGVQKDAGNIMSTSVQFKDANRHYFPITQGKDLHVIYTYTNTGDHPLLITDVLSSCGCAKVKFTERPIEPGGEGVVMVDYDSYKNIGYSQVFITVYMNTAAEKMHTLIFDLNIVPEEYSMTDYEKTYKRMKELNPIDEITKAVEGGEGEVGYYTDNQDKLTY